MHLMVKQTMRFLILELVSIIKRLSLTLFSLLLGCWINVSFAEDVYQQPSDFLSEVFSGPPPGVAVLLMSGERRRQATKILGHPPAFLRTRYWMKEGVSAWVLEEIGKVKPITVGIVVKQGLVEDVRILIYRESHGSEVRHSFFTEQFRGAGTDTRGRLTKNIDGIAGATLSVSAVRRLATLALYFDREARVQ